MQYLLMTALILISFSAVFPQCVIKGKITDKLSNEPLIGANITIVDKNLGAATDIDGNFILKNLKPGSYTLKTIYIGYLAESRNIKLQSLNDTIIVNFALTRQNIPLEIKVIAVPPKLFGTNLSIFGRLLMYATTETFSLFRIRTAYIKGERKDSTLDILTKPNNSLFEIDRDYEFQFFSRDTSDIRLWDNVNTSDDSVLYLKKFRYYHAQDLTFMMKDTLSYLIDSILFIPVMVLNRQDNRIRYQILEARFGYDFPQENFNDMDISRGFEKSGIRILYDSGEDMLKANEEKTIFIKLKIPSKLNFHIPYEKRPLNSSAIYPTYGFNLNKDTMKKYNRIRVGISIQFYDELGFRHDIYQSIHLRLE